MAVPVAVDAAPVSAGLGLVRLVTRAATESLVIMAAAAAGLPLSVQMLSALLAALAALEQRQALPVLRHQARMLPVPTPSAEEVAVQVAVQAVQEVAAAAALHLHPGHQPLEPRTLAAAVEETTARQQT